jgi:hypothetical protein
MTPSSDHRTLHAPPACHGVISLIGALSNRTTEASTTSIFPVQRASSCPTRRASPISSLDQGSAIGGWNVRGGQVVGRDGRRPRRRRKPPLAGRVGVHPDSRERSTMPDTQRDPRHVEHLVAVWPESGGRRGVVAVALATAAVQVKASRLFRYRFWLRNALGHGHAYAGLRVGPRTDASIRHDRGHLPRRAPPDRRRQVNPVPHDTKFGSSNVAGAPPACPGEISPDRCPLDPDDRSLSNFDLPSSEGTLLHARPAASPIRRWIEA